MKNIKKLYGDKIKYGNEGRKIKVVIVIYVVSIGNVQIMLLNALKTAVKDMSLLNKDGKPTEGYKRAKGILEQ